MEHRQLRSIKLFIKMALLAFLLTVPMYIPAAAGSDEPAAEGAPSDAENGEAGENTGEEEAEWTVLFYFCGSDLESKYGYASGNLEEIGKCVYPDSYLATIANSYGKPVKQEAVARPGKVNVLIETGGAKEWHTDQPGMQISADKLQRWKYTCYPDGRFGDGPHDGFTLEEELPLANMADPGTLSDFIKWGTTAYPAKKTALILWDHGGGSKTGLFIDELFGGDVMYLHELKKALADGGAHLEAVLLDACMMANIETAWSMADSVNWMIASEEVVPGKGTAVSAWLQELYNNPSIDGERLGRCICDMTQIKYANEDDRQARSILTWSVIDLSKIGAVVSAAERFFITMGEVYTHYPILAVTYAEYIRSSPEFGDGTECMKDIGGIFYNPATVFTMDVKLREDMLNALSEAVVYCVRGAGRSGARGLSFCYAVGFSSDELKVYAENCPSPYYLAFLDAISDWEAPEWVYDRAKRLPPIGEIEEFQITLKKSMTDDGMPGIEIVGNGNNIGGVMYHLYRESERTGEVIWLGKTPCVSRSVQDERSLLVANDPLLWPTIEGNACCMKYIGVSDPVLLYDIPLLINQKKGYLRCGRTLIEEAHDENEESLSYSYEVYGLWAGYDEDNQMPNRSVMDLAGLAGQDYQLLYPPDAGDTDNISGYETGDELTIYRVLDVEEMYLPAGTYYLEYEVDDAFMRPARLDRIPMHWDGENLTFPEDFSWDGTVEIDEVKGKIKEEETA